MEHPRAPLTTADVERPDWSRSIEGLLPAIVQDPATGRVLMLGWMNQEALRLTLATGDVTFFSRSRSSLWRKGETSGNTLALERVLLDCDRDALLVEASPAGPTCHEGTTACFGEDATTGIGFLGVLERIIADRQQAGDDASYTASLFQAGVKRIAQKVGEEGVETALAATAGDDAELLGEVADLVFHLLVLLRSRGLSLAEVIEVLQARHSERATR